MTWEHHAQYMLLTPEHFELLQLVLDQMEHTIALSFDLGPAREGNTFATLKEIVSSDLKKLDTDLEIIRQDFSKSPDDPSEIRITYTVGLAES